MSIKVKDGRTIIPISPERIGDIEHLPLEERVSIILDLSLSGEIRNFAQRVKAVNYISHEKGVNIDFKDYSLGEDSKISARINMILGDHEISLRSFFDGAINHAIIYDLLKMTGSLTGRYQLKNDQIYLGPKEITEIIPATESPYLLERAKDIYGKLYDPKNINQTRTMAALRFTNHDQLQGRAEELYSKMLVEFLGVDFTSQ